MRPIPRACKYFAAVFAVYIVLQARIHESWLGEPCGAPAGFVQSSAAKHCGLRATPADANDNRRLKC